jgi:transaldolase
MKIYGAGSLEDIRKCNDLGVTGILTNPDGFDRFYKGEMTLDEIAQAIVSLTNLPVYIQVHGRTAEDIVARAQKINSLSPSQIGFKIIADEKGFLAISRLQKLGINCIATTLFTISQAAVAASVGAFGICPFISRSREIGMDPGSILRTIRAGYDRLPRSPEIIAVSLKGIGDIEMAIAAGADAVGMRYPAIVDMMSHPLTSKAEILFGKNWSRVKGEDVLYLGDFSKTDGLAE